MFSRVRGNFPYSHCQTEPIVPGHILRGLALAQKMKIMKTMTCKTIGIVALFMGSIPFLASGQYVEFGFGYSGAAGGDFVSKRETVVSDDNNFNKTDHTVVKGASLGKGMDIDGTFGIMMNENFGAELGLSYHLGSIGGKTTILEEDEKTVNTQQGEETVTEETETVRYASMFRVNPGVKFTGGDEIKPYGRFGFIFGQGRGERSIRSPGR